MPKIIRVKRAVIENPISDFPENCCSLLKDARFFPEEILFGFFAEDDVLSDSYFNHFPELEPNSEGLYELAVAIPLNDQLPQKKESEYIYSHFSDEENETIWFSNQMISFLSFKEEQIVYGLADMNLIMDKDALTQLGFKEAFPFIRIKTVAGMTKQYKAKTASELIQNKLEPHLLKIIECVNNYVLKCLSLPKVNNGIIHPSYSKYSFDRIFFSISVA